MATSETARAVKATLMDSNFFSVLHELTTLLTPIYKAQIEAESDSAHIGLVKERWHRVMKHIEDCNSTSAIDIAELIQSLERRYAEQINDTHYLAHWLTPIHIGKSKFYEGEQARVIAVLRTHISPDRFGHSLRTFLSYYNRTGMFKDTDSRWEFKEDPILFWQMYMDEDRQLAALATRMLNTLANSAPSERAFSAMKATHTQARNRLSAERVNKLLFI